MTLPIQAHVRALVEYYDANLLSIVTWDGSLTTGALTIGAVTQSGNWDIRNISGTVSLPTGAATAARQDTAQTSLTSIDGKVPALGQALAAASTPVVLPAAQITTLTPPAAITGFALEATQLLQATAAKQDTGNASLATIATDVAPLITAQEATATSVVGPLVQSLVNVVSPSYLDNVVAPASLNLDGRLRTITGIEEAASVWDAFADDGGWNQQPSAMNFDLTNQLTVESLWE